MSEPIWFHPAPIDFLNQIDGLIMLVADQLALNPISGQLFLFRDRTGKKIKIPWWDRNGFWLFYKRLEKGRLIFPSSKTVMSLTKILLTVAALLPSKNKLLKSKHHIHITVVIMTGRFY